MGRHKKRKKKKKRFRSKHQPNGDSDSSSKETKLHTNSKESRKAGKNRMLTLAISILLGLATLLGGIVALLTLLPRVSVTPSDPVDPINPFSASFTITNNGFVPLSSVDALLGIGQVATAPALLDPNFVPNFESRIVRPEWKNHNLKVDESFTITPADIFGLAPGDRLGGADIAIVVSFKIWIIPIKREKIYRFIARKQTNEQFYWYSIPVEEIE